MNCPRNCISNYLLLVVLDKSQPMKSLSKYSRIAKQLTNRFTSTYLVLLANDRGTGKDFVFPLFLSLPIGTKRFPVKVKP